MSLNTRLFLGLVVLLLPLVGCKTLAEVDKALTNAQPEYYYKVTITQSDVETKPIVTRYLEVGAGRVAIRHNDVWDYYEFDRLAIEKVQ